MNTPALWAVVARVKPDSVMVTAVEPVGWPPIVRMSCVTEAPVFVPVIPLTLDAVPSKDGPVVLTK